MSLLESAAPRFAVNAFSLEFTVMGEPEQGGSKTVGRRKNGSVFYRDDNPKVYGWKEKVAEVAGTLMEGREPWTGPLVLEVTFYFERPAGHYNRRGLKPSARRHPSVRPDLTKLLRPLEDALNKIAWKDDSQIVIQSARKVYGSPARAEVRVTALP